MLSCISSLNQLVLRPLVCVPVATRLLHISPVNDAARKGTREKAKKKKVKVEVKKVGFIPHNMRGKDKYDQFNFSNLGHVIRNSPFLG
jgi:hypothetical protein